jgi:hypothetical protein
VSDLTGIIAVGKSLAEFFRVASQEIPPQQGLLIKEQDFSRWAEDVESLVVELARHKPEERVVFCFCEDEAPPFAWQIVRGQMVWRWSTELYSPGLHCPRCGAQLCADGVARRNADSTRVQRVREALARSATDCYGVPLAVRKASAVIDAIRDALDPPTLGSLRGIAPGMTGENDSVEFVRQQRDGDPEEVSDGG